MNVVVEFENGERIYPIFEPAPGRLEALDGFYKQKFEAREIRGYTITDDSGNLLVWRVR